VSSYGSISVQGFELFTSRNGPSPDALIVFREDEKVIKPFDVPTGADPEEFPRTQLVYRATASVIRDRLELLGFTEDRVRALFENARAEEIERLNEYELQPLWREEPQSLRLAEEREIWRELTYERWLDHFARILREKPEPLAMHTEEWKGATPIGRHMLQRHRDLRFGFPGYDERVFLRAVCSIVEPDELFEYDLTDLLEAGYIEEDEDLTGWSSRVDPEVEFFGLGIIVLTEGKSDQRFLQRSMRLLAPHVAHYFTFVDFDLHKVEGGAGRLVHALKVFAGAGVANRIIALFDNDTGALSALQSLKEVPFARNIRVLRYPDLPLGKDYPTLGPHGLIPADVNGLAGSLELYFGRDVLTNPDGTLVPVQWRGFDGRLGQYQGEVMQKGELQRRFSEKLEACEVDRSRLSEFDWTGMQLIIDDLREAFNRTPGSELDFR